VCIGNATDDFSSGTLAPHWSPWDNCGTTAVSAGALVLDRPAACPGTLGGSLGAVLDTCNFEVCGDFDAQIDFALTNFAIPATASRYAGMSVHSPAAATPAWNLSVERLDSSYVNANVPQQQNYKAYTTSSVDADSTFVATADTSGRFRITRVGTTLTAYYWNTSAWVSITATSAPADPMLVLGVYAGSDDPTAFTVAFDNFSIVSTP
jgi:dipeptidyl aminopeptidase/acylaminoacyl peptidase